MFNGTVNFMFTFLMLLGLDALLGAGRGTVALVTRQRCFVLVTVALFALTGAALLLPRTAQDVALALPLEAIPTMVGPWRPAAPPPDEILPRDSRANDSLARGYTDGARTTWIAIGYYPNQTETRRPATGTLVYRAAAGPT